MSKHTIVTALRGGTLLAALCAGVLFAPSAIAGESTESEIDNKSSVVSAGDVGSGNAINACHNSVNALGVQVTDIANGLAANVPALNEESVSAAEGGAGCNASATTVEHDDSDNGDNGNGDGDNGHNGGDDGHDNGDNGNGHNGGGNGHNGGGAGNGGNGAADDADEHADANGNAPRPVPAKDHISVTG